MDNHFFNKLLKIQGELAEEFNRQRKCRKYEKQLEEKRRWRANKVKPEIDGKVPNI